MPLFVTASKGITVIALKGRNISAQGEALGKQRTHPYQALKGRDTY